MPTAAGEEMTNPRRDVPFPASQVSGLTGYATLTGAGLILGRRRSPRPGPVLGQVRHSGRDEPAVRAGGDRVDDRRFQITGADSSRYFAAVLGLTFWALLATVALIWPGFGVNWFGGGGNPNDNLAALSFSHQRLQYELTQIVPLAVIVGVGVVFYLLGGKTRRETAAEPVAPAYVPADHHEPAP